jgi:hypothetical protein
LNEAVIAAVLVAEVVVHLFQEALPTLVIVVFRRILGAGTT